MKYFLYLLTITFVLGCSEGSGTQDLNSVTPLGAVDTNTTTTEECTPNSIVGTYRSSYTTTDVSFDGNKLVLAHTNGIDILDITDKHEPVFLGSMTLQDDVNKAKIKGSLVFAYLANVALNDLSIKVINISNVKNPTIVSTIAYDILYGDIHVESNFIHFGGEVNASKGRYYIYDFSDQFDPQEAAVLDLSILGDPNTFNLALGSFVQKENHLYAQSNYPGSVNNIYVIDITDRTTPVERFNISSVMSYLTGSDTHIFAGGKDRLKGYTIDSQAYLVEANNTTAGSEEYNHITAIGNNVYSFGRLNGEISITDFSNITTPILTEEKIYVHTGENMVSDERYLYVADGAGLKIIDTCR